MYAITGTAPDGEVTYWNGGQIFSVYPQDAARFVKEVDAEETVAVLMKAWPDVKVPYKVRQLPDDIDA